MAKAVTYRRGGVTKVSLRGTNLMPGGIGQAQVENKGNRVEIEVKFQGMEQATKFGFEFLTYTLWAISPQGRSVNLGEVEIKNGDAQVKAITDMQTFGMVVTAEPYFAVSQPGDEVVLENAGDTGGESIGASYELVPHGAYSSLNTKIENVIFGIDRKTPIELFEARNAVQHCEKCECREIRCLHDRESRPTVANGRGCVQAEARLQDRDLHSA